MGKFTTLLSRVRGMSIKRMLRNARQASLESGRSMLSILPDMVLCAGRYGVGYLDYLCFGFARIRDDARRRTFMTMEHNRRLILRFNDPEKRDIFENKLTFCEVFHDLLGRGFLNLEQASEAEFAAFAKDRGVVFAKQLYGYGGSGVRRIDLTSEPDHAALYARLKAEGFGLVEDAIVQHPQMNRLCETSVNTVRIVTILTEDGESRILYALVRMGKDGSHVDNVSSGGMYAPLDAEGSITAPAFCEKEITSYEIHPDNGTPLVGFHLPLFDRASELVRRAAERVPEVRYVGWDVAITEHGPLLVEGNTVPGYDMCQNYRHRPGGIGILPRFQEILGPF